MIEDDKFVFIVPLEMVGPAGRQRRICGAKSFPRGEAVTKMGASEPIFVTEEEYGR